MQSMHKALRQMRNRPLKLLAGLSVSTTLERIIMYYMTVQMPQAVQRGIFGNDLLPRSGLGNIAYAEVVLLAAPILRSHEQHGKLKWIKKGSNTLKISVSWHLPCRIS
jgi:hypothetical protein